MAGLALKTVYFDTMPAWLGLLMYLGLGWLGLISTVAIALRSGVRFILPLVWGALAYTAGALVDFLDWPLPVPGVIGPHELFHLAVLAGISFHWAFIRGIAGDVPALHFMGGGSEIATGKRVAACSPEPAK
jgi:channel protein (hemolysin III family)